MTTPFTSSSTPNPNAPPPGSPPPAMPAEGARTQEERLLAAAGYLGYFTGFWLVVPIVIYVFYRDKSRFVAHHALRAALYHILAVPVFLLSWILSFAITFGVAIAMSDRRGAGAGRGDWEGMAISTLWMVTFVLPWVIYVAICGVAAIRAFQGNVRTGGLVGRLVERFLAQEKTVAR